MQALSAVGAEIVQEQVQYQKFYRIYFASDLQQRCLEIRLIMAEFQ